MNNYEILGLQKGASISEVKRKFRALSKQYHPDIPGGDASKFISIRKAYEALLEGDSGDQPQQDQFWDDLYRQQQQGSARAQWDAQQAYMHQQRDYFRQVYGEYKFRDIVKDDEGYRIRFIVKNISKIVVFGKHGQRIGFFDMRGDVGNVSLLIEYKFAEWGEYVFECVLEDVSGSREVLTYKVKPPLKGWEKLLNKLKFW